MIVCWSIFSWGQNLLDIYKGGTVELVPDAEYAKNNNWDEIFSSYSDIIYNKPMGKRKSLVIAPDGSVVVNNAYRNFYTKFSPNGTFLEEFGIINNSGRQLKKAYSIVGVVNDNTFITGLDNMGNMRCLDFEGNLKKELKLDYMARQILALPNGKIAVVGWVIWKTKFRDFVAIVDYETNEQKIIWEHFTQGGEFGEQNKLFYYSYNFEKQGGLSCSTMPFANAIGIKARPRLATVNNQLILANPTNGEIITYDLNGKLISRNKMDLKNGQISIEEQKEIQKKAIEKYKSLNPLRFEGFAGKASAEESKKVHNYLIQAMEEDLNKITKPIAKPYFSTMIQDSDNNLLFFDFAEEQNANKFNVWVYQNGGGFVSQSSFMCKDYNLQINPGKMVFHNGFIYGLQELKETPNVPLRLVRFKLHGK